MSKARGITSQQISTSRNLTEKGGLGRTNLLQEGNQFKSDPPASVNNGFLPLSGGTIGGRISYPPAILTIDVGGGVNVGRASPSGWTGYIIVKAKLKKAL